MAKSQLRIIAGQWRGRKVPFITEPGLRPTPDRVRETAFNWLAAAVHQAVCLDAFAGSGALSFEALSRGAQAVTMLEMNRKVVGQLQQNVQTLNCAQQVDLRQADALTFLQHAGEASFDLIFLDPPFGKGLIGKSLRLIVQQHWLNGNGLIYYEAELPVPDALLAELKLQSVKQKQAGEVHFGLLRHA